MNTLAQITQRPLIRPSYARAETYKAWISINADLVMNFWRDTAFASGEDPDRLPYADLYEFAQDQFKTSSPTPSDPQSPRNRISSAPAGESDGATAGLGAAKASLPSPVTCRARYYDAASRILEDELQLFTHENCNELGALIEQWINDARDNWEPR